MSGEKDEQDGKRLGGIIQELRKDEALINGDKAAAKTESKEESGVAGAEKEGEKKEASPPSPEKEEAAAENKEDETPFFNIDRRGSVLANNDQRKLDEAGPPVSIPIPGQINDHPRHGSSFVSSVFRNVGPAVPR